MTNITSTIKKEQSNGSSAEIQKGIENHKKAATHFEAAAKHHNDAAKHHEAGNHEKASESTVKAHGQHCLANECQKEDIKQHAMTK